MIRHPAAMLALVALSSLLLPPASATAGGRYYNSDSTIDTSHPDWMRWIPDHHSLAELSIPGTHDTMADNGGPSPETQGLSLRAQLDAGIRALDIRARHIADSFAIHHGSIFLGYFFGGDVLAVCQDFLNDNPTETIIMRLKNERPDDEQDNTRTFAETYEWYRSLYPNLFHQDTRARIPTLGEVRGKVVVLHDFTGGTAYGLHWELSPLLEIQDEFYVCCIWEIDAKWQHVADHLLLTNHPDPGDENDLYINFTSGAGGLFPSSVAGGECCTTTGVNEFFLDFLFAGPFVSLYPKTGVMMMDFPGAALIDGIIARNMPMAAQVADIASDFSTLANNMFYSTSGNVDSRTAQFKNFFVGLLPDHHWNVFASHTSGSTTWGYSYVHAQLHRRTDWVDGHSAVVFNSYTDTNSTPLITWRDFLQQQPLLVSVDGPTQASHFRSLLASQYPQRRWSTMARSTSAASDDDYDLRAVSGLPVAFRSDPLFFVFAWGSDPNQSPVADASGPYTGTVGEAMTLDGSASLDPDGRPLFYRWDTNGDGSWDTDWARTPTLTSALYLEPYTGSLRLQVTDGWASAVDTTAVTIVPEPGFAAALACGAGLLTRLRRERRRRTSSLAPERSLESASIR